MNSCRSQLLISDSASLLVTTYRLLLQINLLSSLKVSSKFFLVLNSFCVACTVMHKSTFQPLFHWDESFSCFLIHFPFFFGAKNLVIFFFLKIIANQPLSIFLCLFFFGFCSFSAWFLKIYH